MHQCTAADRSSPERYRLSREKPPTINPPRWWRAMWLILDTRSSDCGVVERFFAFGPAEVRVRCLNGKGAAWECQNSSPAESRTERFAWAA